MLIACGKQEGVPAGGSGGSAATAAQDDCKDPLPASIPPLSIDFGGAAALGTVVKPGRVDFALEGGKLVVREPKYEEPRGFVELLLMTDQAPLGGALKTGRFDLVPEDLEQEKQGKFRAISLYVTSMKLERLSFTVAPGK